MISEGVNILYELEGVGDSSIDPVATLHQAKEDGLDIGQSMFVKHVHWKSSVKHCWAALRNSRLVFDMSKNDVFYVLQNLPQKYPHKMSLFKMVISEFRSFIHPLTLETMLHISARAGFNFAVLECMKRRINPFVRNRDGNTARDVSKSDVCRNSIKKYEIFVPEHAHFFGPFFQERAFAFLLVCQRLRKTKNVLIPKEIRLLILQQLSLLEVYWI